MCGIIGSLERSNHEKEATIALARIAYRGKDAQQTKSTTTSTFAHCLHAIVGNAPQPLVHNEWIFGANCEIYNWKELKEQYNLAGDNDAEILFSLLQLQETLTEDALNALFKEIDGVFAFFLHNTKENYTILARDSLGIKPLWFANTDGLLFASERKAIASETVEPEELNPRKIIKYDHSTKEVMLWHQTFFTITHNPSYNNTEGKKELETLLTTAVTKRIPQKKLGILFSGGFDSTMLAWMLTQQKIPFTAYMTLAEGKENEQENAERIAKELDFPLTIIPVTEERLKAALPTIITTIESADPIKVEVGAVMYFALEEAKKDNIKVIFSGVGADDLFMGYGRMHNHQNGSLDSLSSLRKLYEKDLYRDDVLTMAQSIELRLPYLDKTLVQACLNIPNEYKTGEVPKSLLRTIAIEMGMPESLTTLKRNAAQYSSGLGRLAKKLVKKEYKGTYYGTILGRANSKLGVLFSSGKDSVYALHIQQRLQYETACLITMDSHNKDSFMFHTPAIERAEIQAESLGIPLILEKTQGEEEKELADLERAMQRAKDEYKIQGIVTGAIFSNYQRTRIEELCDQLNLKCYSPLWHMDQHTELKNLLKEGFKIVMTKVAADGLDSSWLNKVMTEETITQLQEVEKKVGINVAGEGGEFETFVLDAPLFNNVLTITKSSIEEDTDGAATLIIESLESKKKD